MVPATKRGLLLVNLGTPDGEPGKGPTPLQVRTYLKEFLMDPWVVDISAPLRWLLVHGVILPRRPQVAAPAYQKIWTERGSPLLFHLKDLARAVQAELGPEWRVEIAMRYQNPSIEKGLRALNDDGIKETLVVPLYPQYSLAATASSVHACQAQAIRAAPGMKLTFFPAFYDALEFLEAFAQVGQRALGEFNAEHLLFSFHGLPERQVKKTDPTGRHCLASGACCDQIGVANRDCFRAQCFSTARSLASKMGLAEDRYTVCFQSRLGRTPWIKPYTDEVFAELARKGVKRLAVICPAFVADCLETLEEIQIRGREQFKRLGGEELVLVPSLNSEPSWVKGLCRMVAGHHERGGGH